MSIFKKIKSAFIIESQNDTESSTEDQEFGAPEEVVKAHVESANEPKISYDTPEGKVDQKFTNILLKAMQSQNQPGFDYIEFKQSIQNLAKMDMDEPTVYKSAYATAQTLGATPQKLIESARDYLNVLEGEGGKFANALASQRSKQIDGGLQEIQRYEQSVKVKKDQIAKLQKEIDDSEAKLKSMKSEIKESSTKIEATKSDFTVSLGNLVQQIQLDIENIGKYLK